MSLTAEVQAFVTDHRPHGTLTGDADDLTPNGYRLWIACPCGVMLERWITPEAAAEDLAALALLN
jgi:hypothetical protein